MNHKDVSKYRKGGWVRFIIDSPTEREWVERYGIDVNKAYRVLLVRYVDDTWLLDIDAKNGSGWGENWFETCKNSIILDIINDL